MSNKRTGPKVLILDIETAPILAHVWKIWDENIGLNQIERDWFILSFSAKWLDSDKVFYMDQRNVKNIENDKKLLKELWKLMDEADIVLTHNGKKFDVKKINARFVLQGFQPPSPFKQIDTLTIARKYFGFTSNKLEHLSEKLCVKYKKLKHAKFSGFSLWKECLAGNAEAWKEMELYNKNDVLALEEVYNVLKSWDASINFSVYSDSYEQVCHCGSKDFQKRGHAYTTTGMFQRYRCKKCGTWTRGAENLFDKDKKKSLHRKI